MSKQLVLLLKEHAPFPLSGSQTKRVVEKHVRLPVGRSPYGAIRIQEQWIYVKRCEEPGEDYAWISCADTEMPVCEVGEWVHYQGVALFSIKLRI